MSQVIEETEPEKGQSKAAKVAGASMALMGASALSTPGEHHADHGYAAARWVGVTISGIGWLAGGIAFPFHLWVVVIIGAALQIVALVVNLSMNAAGMGAKANDDWAAAKAEAKQARAAAAAS
jgi:hypothetical protein